MGISLIFIIFIRLVFSVLSQHSTRRTSSTLHFFQFSPDFNLRLMSLTIDRRAVGGLIDYWSQSRDLNIRLECSSWVEESSSLKSQTAFLSSLSCLREYFVISWTFTFILFAALTFSALTLNQITIKFHSFFRLDWLSRFWNGIRWWFGYWRL